MKRTRPESKRIAPFSAPEARRRLAGDEITGNRRAMNSRPEGTRDSNAGPALLPERESYAVTVPAVTPQANFRRASGAEESGAISHRLLRSISCETHRAGEKVSPMVRQFLFQTQLVGTLFELVSLSPQIVSPLMTQLYPDAETGFNGKGGSR